MLVEEVLDLLGRDVFALSDDDVLQSAGKHDVSALVDMTEIPGTEPTVTVERIGVERGVGVSLEYHRALQTDLAVLARAAHTAIGIDHTNVDPGDRGTIGEHQLIMGVGGATLGDHRAFGHAIAMTDGDPHLFENLDEHLRWLRSPSTRQQTQ